MNLHLIYVMYLCLFLLFFVVFNFFVEKVSPFIILFAKKREKTPKKNKKTENS